MSVCVCVCLSVCLSVWPSPIVEPKPIDRSRSLSTSRVPLQIYRARFSRFRSTLKIKGSSYEKKNKKNWFSQKWLQRFWLNFCGFIVHSKPNNVTLSAFPGKIPETRKIVLIFYTTLNLAPKPTEQSRSHSISRVPLQISLARFSRFRSTLKIKSRSHKKK